MMNPKFLSFALILLVSCITVVVMQAQPAGKITWSSAHVHAGITSTTTVEKTLTFSSDKPIQNLSLEAVPEIARFIEIQPKTFAQVPAGQPQMVRLTFSAPAGAQFGAYEGTIHARLGKRTVPQTLKTAVTFAVVTLPPDPGEAGKATLAGTDSDGDSVRDDIQRYVAFTYPDSAKTRAAMTQMARAEQQALLHSSNRDLSRAYLADYSNGSICLAYVTSYKTALINMRRIRAEVLNTKVRTAAWLQANEHASGRVTSVPISASAKKARCSFNPDLLEN